MNLLGALPAECKRNRYTVNRLPVETVRISPVEIVAKGDGHFFADFGQVSFAGLELKVSNVRAGQKIEFRIGEAISAPGTVHCTPGGSVRYHASEVILEPGRNIYRVLLPEADGRLMSEEVGSVMPFRYVEIIGAPAIFNATDICQLAAYYTFDDKAAHFECADPKLNAIWKLCRYTIKATSFGGIFVDGDRERLPYEADAYINQLGWFYCTSDRTLPRYTWQYLITHPTWPTEWILFSVLLAWDDYLYTGDTVGLEEFYSDLKAKTLLALERTDGLISTVEPVMSQEVGEAIHISTIRDIVDWPAGERDEYEMVPINTVVNAFHAIALKRMSDIARILNKDDDAVLYSAAASKTIQSLNEKLIDQETGLYIDGEGSRHSSLHANFFPLAFGLVPLERQSKVVKYIASRDMACSVYGAQFYIDALFDHGQADRARALMTADGDRSWSHMVDQGTTITWEAWDGKYKPNQDWNHAWGAAPANIIPRKLMGIEPIEAGFRKVLIQPRMGSLKWAEICIPTELGSVLVRVENSDAYRIKVEIPLGMKARVVIPIAKVSSSMPILFNGQPTAGIKIGESIFLDDIKPGTHLIDRL